MRVFSDETFPLGSRLDLEVLIPSHEPVRCWAEVVWLVELEEGSPARFDIGVKFTDMDESVIQALATALVP